MRQSLPNEKTDEKWFQVNSLLIVVIVSIGPVAAHFGNIHWTIILLFYSFLLPLLHYIEKLANLFVHHMIIARGNHSKRLKRIEQTLREINSKLPDGNKVTESDYYDPWDYCDPHDD